MIRQRKYFFKDEYRIEDLTQRKLANNLLKDKIAEKTVLLKSILAQGKGLVITFVGSFNNGSGEASLYTYDGRFSLEGSRLRCPTINYTRHISKIIMIRKGEQLLFGKRCRSCGRAVPKSHGNCFRCYSINIETV